MERVKELFKDADFLCQQAIEELEKGEDKLRDAAEKAWGAALKSTNALILARAGRELEGAKDTTTELHKLAGKDKEIDEKLIGRYHTRRDFLHGDCFYMGVCEPKDEIERRIRETNLYIEDARRLARI